MSRHQPRHFANPFSDYKKEDGVLLNPDSKLNNTDAKNVREAVKKLLVRLHDGIAQTPFERDNCVYTGPAGITYLYLHLHDNFSSDDKTRQEYLNIASNFLGKPREKRCTFLCGDAGVLALKARLFHKLGQQSEVRDAISRLEHMHKDVIEDRRLPDEVLYGRAGYLYSLLHVRHYLGQDSINSEIIVNVVKRMIESGVKLSQNERSNSPLMYTWYDEHYLGAAHGLAGIFAILLQVKESAVQSLINKYVRPSVDYMITLMFDSGNSPASLESHDTDKLIHWCHGAPGWVHMFAQAYLVFEEEKYLHAAKRCAEVIWHRGILQKGYGLCHGTGGNAYAFLVLYQITKNQAYIHRAIKFAEWCFQYGSHGCRTPDTPYSMFEGMAGTIYFLVDLLDPSHAAFPSLVLPPK